MEYHGVPYKIRCMNCSMNLLHDQVFFLKLNLKLPDVSKLFAICLPQAWILQNCINCPSAVCGHSFLSPPPLLDSGLERPSGGGLEKRPDK